MNENKEIGKAKSVEWQVARREQFVKIIREGKRTLKFSEEERKLVIQLADLLTRNNIDHKRLVVLRKNYEINKA